MSRERYLQRFALPADPLIPGLREMREGDVAKVGRLMRRYMRRFDMAPRFSDEEVRHVMLSGRGVDEGGKRVGQVTWTYVVEVSSNASAPSYTADAAMQNRETGAITDVCSFYSLPSSVLDNAKHKVLNAAYLFYYATDVPFTTPAPPAEGTSASASATRSPAAASAAPAPRQKAEDLEPWQRSGITGLSEEEEADERDVPRWDQEDATLKRRLSVRLNALVQDLLILAKKVGGSGVIATLSGPDPTLRSSTSMWSTALR
jgi:glycylpeptide N-tetradecanoyltransferase